MKVVLEDSILRRVLKRLQAEHILLLRWRDLSAAVPNSDDAISVLTVQIAEIETEISAIADGINVAAITAMPGGSRVD